MWDVGCGMEYGRFREGIVWNVVGKYRREKDLQKEVGCGGNAPLESQTIVGPSKRYTVEINLQGTQSKTGNVRTEKIRIKIHLEWVALSGLALSGRGNTALVAAVPQGRKQKSVAEAERRGRKNSEEERCMQLLIQSTSEFTRDKAIFPFPENPHKMHTSTYPKYPNGHLPPTSTSVGHGVPLSKYIGSWLKHDTSPPPTSSPTRLTIPAPAHPAAVQL